MHSRIPLITGLIASLALAGEQQAIAADGGDVAAGVAVGAIIGGVLASQRPVRVYQPEPVYAPPPVVYYEPRPVYYDAASGWPESAVSPHWLPPSDCRPFGLAKLASTIWPRSRDWPFE